MESDGRKKEIDESGERVDDPKHQLFLRQKATLDLFLERGAISHAQYEKSLHDMAEKMGYAGEQ